MTFDDVVEYMRGDDWPIDPLRERTFRTSFRGRLRSFPFFVHVDGAYLILAAVPYVRIPFDESAADRLMDRLLHMNREMNLAKFSVDDDGDVVLSVEWPLAELDPSELRDALDVITFYADEYWPEIARLAGEPEVKPTRPPKA
jgi:hypothetical protein